MTNPIQRELTIPNKTEELFNARSFVKDFSNESSIDKTNGNRLTLAIDEALANIVEHAEGMAQNSESDIEISLQLTADDTQFEAVIRDTAVRFDPTDLGDIDLQRHLQSGKNGGLGVFLMRQIMDKVSYTFEEGSMNELRLVKFL